MKKLISNYSFNRDTRTITFTDFDMIELERILLITNSRTKSIIYNFANPILGGTVTGKTLTLDGDTSIFSNTDPLQIWYETERSGASDELLDALFELIARLDFLPAVRGVSADLRVTPLSTPNMAALTSLNQLAGWPTNGIPANMQNSIAVMSNINNVQ